ncbi:hypothetical protein B9G53_08695 [Pseudanabaena sp. SR411]|uniref:hypothetical protein n=1 Tax=Pseudanabaena sp. SR411 TaxID=1980935 RepID=UPI000B97F37F|nr:hypothetical protein [Pseudanabaena sp. SR411]OYQ65161.1 hypothetical protein B9G53_08695 [Pseudanabaena sp. SR411]
MNTLKPAIAYFALVFGTGFILGTIRVLWIVPKIGVRTAELIEMLPMFAAILLSARWINQHFADTDNISTRLKTGFLALSFLLGAEIALGVILQGVSISEVLLNHDPVSGTVYYAMLILFALMPFLLDRKQS